MPLIGHTFICIVSGPAGKGSAVEVTRPSPQPRLTPALYLSDKLFIARSVLRVGQTRKTLWGPFQNSDWQQKMPAAALCDF